jgi:hypothetical protein
MLAGQLKATRVDAPALSVAWRILTYFQKWANLGTVRLQSRQIESELKVRQKERLPS